MVQVKRIVFLLLVAFTVFSCATFDHKNPYPDMVISQYGNSNVYEFSRSPEKTVILLESSGYCSNLGIKGHRRWDGVRYGAYLLQDIPNTSVVIPEKLDWLPGIDYAGDITAKENYTADRLIADYTSAINEYLKQDRVKSVIIMGISEGAILLPVIYNNIVQKHKITSLVSYAGGGLSVKESYTLLSTSKLLPVRYQNMFSHIIEACESKKNYDSIEILEMSMTYRYFDRILNIRPFDYYENIHIPVLFVHGEKDVNVPVESTKYVEDHLPEKPFTYKYYPDMYHGPANRTQLNKLRSDIAEWINAH